MGVSRTFGIATAPARTGAERATLVRRTYLLVFAGVLVTMLGVAFTLSQPALLEFSLRNRFVLFLATFLPLLGAQALRDRFPANIGLTLAFTFAEGVFIAPFLWLMERQAPGITGQAGLLTGSTFAVLTAYAALSKRDFSAWGGFLITGLWVLIGASLLTWFFPSAAAGLWIAGVGTLIFSGLLVFDTARLLRADFGPNDYVVAAVQIYLDLLNLFLFILSLLGGGRRR